MPRTYKGWLPTATGRLSFSLIGETSHPYPAKTANEANADRHIISYQKRVLLDTALPLKEWLAPFILEHSGAFYFACVAKCSNKMSTINDTLEGQLFIFDKTKSWESVERELSYAQTMLSRLAQSDSLLKCTIKKIINTSIFFVNFKLERSGVVTITTPSELSSSRTAPILSANPKARDRIYHTICAQLFYFLRDLTHEHQHHSPKTDTLLDIYKAENDDKTWRSESLRILYRKILEFKRNRRDEVYCSSLGLLVYAKSFRSICKKTLEDDLINPPINDQLLEESIRASQKATKNTIQEKIKSSETLRNIIISFLGLFLSFIGLARLTEHKVDIPQDSMLIYLATWTVQEPVYTLIIVALGVFLACIQLKVVKLKQWKIIRGVFKILQALPQYINASIWITIGLIAFFVFLKIIQHT